MNLLDAVRSWISPTCDVPGCDGDPELLMVDGGVALLCSVHTIDYAIAVVTEGRA